MRKCPMNPFLPTPGRCSDLYIIVASIKAISPICLLLGCGYACCRALVIHTVAHACSAKLGIPSCPDPSLFSLFLLFTLLLPAILLNFKSKLHRSAESITPLRLSNCSAIGCHRLRKPSCEENLQQWSYMKSVNSDRLPYIFSGAFSPQLSFSAPQVSMTEPSSNRM